MTFHGKLNVLAALAIFSAVPATGCRQVRQQPVGTAAGAGVGALAGAALADSAVGGLLGAIVGGAVGNVVAQAIDDDDRSELEQAFDTGQPVVIEEPARNLTLRVTPMQQIGSYAGYAGPCRSFVIEAQADVGVDEGRGVACQVNGDWRIVDGAGQAVARGPQ